MLGHAHYTHIHTHFELIMLVEAVNVSHAEVVEMCLIIGLCFHSGAFNRKVAYMACVHIQAIV